MGLWVLSECLRTWSHQRIREASLAAVLEGAEDAPPLRTVVDINDARLLPPGTCRPGSSGSAEEAGEPIPRTPVAIARTVIDSLALAYRKHLRTAAELAGRSPSVVHIVGGGSQNHLLCQLTADASGLPVLAGPSEAAAPRQRAGPGAHPRGAAAGPGRDARSGPSDPRAASLRAPSGLGLGRRRGAARDLRRWMT